MKKIDFLNSQYIAQYRPVIAKNCIATSQPLAAQAGINILQQGGNAVDAAIATAITLVVVEPTMNSLGGDAFAIVWDGGRMHGFNASGRSPHAWTREHFNSYQTMPLTGWDSVTTPGAISSWVTLSEKFGRLDFRKLFTTAIHYAEQGFLVSPITAAHWREFSKPFKNNSEFAKVFLPKGRAPYAGELFKAPYHANSLRKIAESKGKAFYHGQLAEAMGNYAQQQGALFSIEDLKQHKLQEVEPLSVCYRGYDLFELPPNGQGLTVLIALGILQHFDLHEYAVDSVASLHLQIEAMKLAFADARRYIADPAYMSLAPTALLASAYLAKRAKLIRMDQARMPECGFPDEQGTVYLTTADSQGMMVSFIQSHYRLFGSGVVIPETGILMQNRGACFTLEKGHPNEVGGNKLPFHTIIPAFLMQDQLPLMSFGVMGGHMQAQGHVQFMVRLCDYQQDPQTILNAPRWYISPDNKISLEVDIKPSIVQGLRDKGHDIISSPMITYGGGQAIYCLDDGYLAASDPRKDGQAVGY